MKFMTKNKNMDRGAPLTKKENGKIAAVSLDGANVRTIASAIRWSKNAAQNYLNSSARHKIRKSPERPQIMTTAVTTRLTSAASSSFADPKAV